MNSKRLLAYLALWEAQVALLLPKERSLKFECACVRHFPRRSDYSQQKFETFDIYCKSLPPCDFLKINGMVWCCSGVVDYSGKKITAQQQVNGVLVLNGRRAAGVLLFWGFGVLGLFQPIPCLTNFQNLKFLSVSIDTGFWCDTNGKSFVKRSFGIHHQSKLTPMIQ